MRSPGARTSAALAVLALGSCSTAGPGPTALSRVAVSVSPVTGEPVAGVLGCPDWARSSREDFTNRSASNFGCADALNFVAQLADPRDAEHGRGTGAQDAAVAGAAVELYRAGKVKPLRAGGSDGSASLLGPSRAQ